MKYCNRCDKSLEDSHFYSGQNWCKQCRNEYARDRRAGINRRSQSFELIRPVESEDETLAVSTPPALSTPTRVRAPPMVSPVTSPISPGNEMSVTSRDDNATLIVPYNEARMFADKATQTDGYNQQTTKQITITYNDNRQVEYVRLYLCNIL